jgi:hypothetical protein
MQSFKRSLSRNRRKLNYLFRFSFIHPSKKQIKKYRDLLFLVDCRHPLELGIFIEEEINTNFVLSISPNAGLDLDPDLATKPGSEFGFRESGSQKTV